jgi:hypothetical protein
MTVSQLYAEKGPLCRYIPTYLGMHVQRLLHGSGVRYINERLVTDVKGERWSKTWGWLCEWRPRETHLCCLLRLAVFVYMASMVSLTRVCISYVP